MATDNVFEALSKFREIRDWTQFHSAENLAKSISIEAAELLECYQWSDDGALKSVREELADVLTYCYYMCMTLELDPEEIILEKLRETNRKYPANTVRGKSDKYTKYD